MNAIPEQAADESREEFTPLKEIADGLPQPAAPPLTRVKRVFNRKHRPTKLSKAREGVQPLLVTRAETQKILNISMSTVLVLERQGKLTPVRLVSASGQVHFRLSQVRALAGEE